MPNTVQIFLPPGLSEENATAKPFHVYDEAFYDIIGTNPTLTVIASTGGDPLFHEAVVWYPPTNEVFFVQNAGAAAAGTGLNKSNVILKISLDQAAAVSSERNASGRVDVTAVNATPPVINSNGATNYRGQFVFTGEGQGNDTAPALYVMNPVEPYNTTVLINNYFGRQFNSLNDVSINPRNGDVYFTDTLYGYLQDFRPSPALPNMVYRLNPSTGAVTVVADGFGLPNGITFSPNGSYAYVTDTGAQYALYGYNFTAPASIYRFTVESDGTWSDRKIFSYVSPGIPDGIHCDTNGNVYSGVGDGVHVWNPSGTLLGKIFIGETSANFNFAGKGRMVICAETQLYYATLAAEGAVVASEMPPS
ncbi:gluconolactonase [Exophiala aquamarina CBS 119918]|uniref:Gluconolactonase n=1 Tax=Exophiala aquamarina CBS 119918 TaxID=1182545 RepID=A0A072PMK8_9EURO|nr:gluconolactonase [Exophiala aquamarina CBS 119918]KEF56750.1 gluconolactonase [Exophiala aquamarina CBS 119918]